MLVVRVPQAIPDRGDGNILLRVERAPRVGLAPVREQVVPGTMLAVVVNGGQQKAPVVPLDQGGLDAGRRMGIPGTVIRRLIPLPTV